MLERVLRFSIEHRCLVVLLLVGRWPGSASVRCSACRSTPCRTSRTTRCRSTRVAPALSPVEVEKQVTFPSRPRSRASPACEYTRSLSRNGFSQVTAVFDDDVDIYFARQQVNERLGEARESLPPGAEPTMGPISTGLGEVYMWTVEYEHPHGEGATVDDGAARLADATALPHAGRRAARDRRRAGGVPAHGAGLDHPPAAQGREGRRRRRRDRRLRQAVPRPARPDEARRATG